MITLSLLHPLNKTPVQHWTFKEEPVIRIGRSTDNHVVLYSAVVSRHHVEIQRTDQGWEIKSLGTNGTYLDGKRIAQAPVQNGIIIRLARSGPNIQIHMAEEKRDPLKELLENRRMSASVQTEAATGATGSGSTEVVAASEVPLGAATSLDASHQDGVSDDDSPTSGNSGSASSPEL
ncbi:MAG TPA: FHA domain-containing protein [Trichocoleus sp.]